MIVKSADEVGGPLEQFSTVGYKLSTNGAKILYPERMVRLLSCSSYSATDEATDNDYEYSTIGGKAQALPPTNFIGG